MGSNQSASNSDGTPSIFNMKIVVVLFCSLAICSSEWQKHGSNLEQQNSRSLFRSHLFSCANEEMMPLVRKCKNEIRFQMGKESRQREDCSRKSEQPDDQVTIDNCRFETKRERMGLTTDCFLMNIGAMNRSTKTIDSAIQKQFSIDSSTLSDAEKADAAATFDDCMAADYTRPYKRFAFRPENFPAVNQSAGRHERQDIDRFFGPRAFNGGSILHGHCLAPKRLFYLNASGGRAFPGEQTSLNLCFDFIAIKYKSSIQNQK